MGLKFSLKSGVTFRDLAIGAGPFLSRYARMGNQHAHTGVAACFEKKIGGPRVDAPGGRRAPFLVCRRSIEGRRRPLFVCLSSEPVCLFVLFLALFVVCWLVWLLGPGYFTSILSHVLPSARLIDDC